VRLARAWTATRAVSSDYGERSRSAPSLRLRTRTSFGSGAAAVDARARTPGFSRREWRCHASRYGAVVINLENSRRPRPRDLRHELNARARTRDVGPDACCHLVDEGWPRSRTDAAGGHDARKTHHAHAAREGRADLTALASPAQWVTQNAALDGRPTPSRGRGPPPPRARHRRRLRQSDETGRGPLRRAYARSREASPTSSEPTRALSDLRRRRIVSRDGAAPGAGSSERRASPPTARPCGERGPAPSRRGLA